MTGFFAFSKPKDTNYNAKKNFLYFKGRGIVQTQAKAKILLSGSYNQYFEVFYVNFKNIFFDIRVKGDDLF